MPKVIKKKESYEKPKVTRIKLDARGAVLGFCKTSSSLGPGGASGNCEWIGSTPCYTDGS